MAPKEKAKELYLKYTNALDIRDLRTNANPFAKQCAIIAVDEIIEAIFWHPLESPNQELEYWQEVKQEIEKL